MGKLSRSVLSLVEAVALVLVVALASAGCTYDAGKLLVGVGTDSGASGGASLDAIGNGDSPTTAVGGAGGAATTGTGGVTGTRGTGGSLLDAPGASGAGGGLPDSAGTAAGGMGSGGVPSGGAGGSTLNTGGANGTGGVGGSSSPPTGDANCGSQTSSTSHEPADVLLVLDRSGSMNESIAESCYCDPNLASGGDGGGTACTNTTNCTTRWSSLTAGLNTTLTSSPDIHWGLELFSSPGGGNCTVNTAVQVQIGASSASAIQTQIAGVSPANKTPTAAAITAATNFLKTVSDNSNKVILLATDGEPNCAAGGSSSTTDVQGTVTAITAAKKAGFLVYVIGIGPEVGNLDNFAQVGGTGNYYPATSSAALASALASISKAVATCTFTLSTTPPDVNNVAVYLDKNLVQKDAANGWSFGANSKTIVLNGSTCEKVTSGAASTVQVLFACAGSPPPQTIP